MRRPGTQIRIAVAVTGIALIVAGAASLLSSAGERHASFSWSVRARPFSLSFSNAKGELVSEATSLSAGPGGRLGYALADGSFHQVTSLLGTTKSADAAEYRVATDEPKRTAVVRVTRTAHGAHISWKLVPSTGVDVVFEALRSPAHAEHFVGTGINHQKVDLNSDIVQLKVSYSCGRSIVTPFYASSAGYGVYFATSAVGHIQFRGTHDGQACDDSNKEHVLCPLVGAPDRVEVCFRDSSLAYNVYSGTPAAVVAAYRRAAGLPHLPAAEQFGLTKWRDRVAGTAQVLDDVHQLTARGIPLSSVLLDNPWERSGCLGALAFDTTRFPDPAALIRAVHRAGVRFMVWVSPLVDTTAGCQSGWPASTLVTGRDQYGLIDFTNTQALGLFRSRIAALAKLGVDGFKGDRGDETDNEGTTFAGGGGTLLHEQYPALFARAVLAGARSAGRPAQLTMFRSASEATVTAGANVWTGDQTPDFTGLRDAIHSLASLGASGFSIAGSDVGGYGTLNGTKILTPEVFARWTQLGAISPIMEIGGQDRAATFWKLGTRATAIAKQSILLHYALAPYLYALARASSRTGAPILQPLGLTSPDDERAWKADLELLAGRDLLAAPVTSSAAWVNVYLPDGDWTDLFRGGSAPGKQTVLRPVPLEEFPLYLRSGTAIPFDQRAPAIWAKDWPLDAIGMRGRAGWLYAPLAGTRTSASSAGRGSLTGNATVDTVEIALHRARRESQVLVTLPQAPSSVQIGGRAVPQAATVAALRHAPSGWIWQAAPFRGALIKLEPGAGAAGATLRLAG